MGNSKIIEDFNLTEVEKTVFNFGFCGLESRECAVLLQIPIEEFKERYWDSFEKGAAYGRLQTLQRYMDISTENSAALYSYMAFREKTDAAILGEKRVTTANPEPISTAEVIRQLKANSD